MLMSHIDFLKAVVNSFASFSDNSIYVIERPTGFKNIKRKYVSDLIIAQENIIGNEKSCKKTVYSGRQTY